MVCPVIIFCIKEVDSSGARLQDVLEVKPVSHSLRLCTIYLGEQLHIVG